MTEGNSLLLHLLIPFPVEQQLHLFGRSCSGLHHKKGIGLVLKLQLQGGWFPWTTYLLAHLHIPMGFHPSVCLPACLHCEKSKSGSLFPCTPRLFLNHLFLLNLNCPGLSRKASLNTYVCPLSRSLLWNGPSEHKGRAAEKFLPRHPLATETPRSKPKHWKRWRMTGQGTSHRVQHENRGVWASFSPCLASKCLLMWQWGWWKRNVYNSICGELDVIS